MRKKIVVLIFLLLIGSKFSQAQCGQNYFLDDHKQYNKVNICNENIQIATAEEHWKIKNNWGLRVEWYDNENIIFLNNLVGNAFLLNIETNEIQALTEHFTHSGFSRVYRLKNEDLLLVGSLEHGNCGDPYPLEICEDKRFLGELYVLQYPYDKPPVALNEPAWEGVALSLTNNQIVWSDTRVPFTQDNLVATAFNYFFKRSNLWTGTIAYDKQNEPYIEGKRKILSKYRIGPVFLEPQNFKGKGNEELIFSAYGIVQGKSDLYVYDFKKNKKRKVKVGKGYNEWEGIHPSFEYGLFENDPSTTLFTDFSPEMYLYDFEKEESRRYLFWKDREDLDGFYIGNTVFSPDGSKLAGVAGAKSGDEGIGYGVGILVKNIEEKVDSLIQE